MKTNCDMCGSKIIDNICDCGVWVDADEMKDNPMKLALEEFNEMKRFTLTGDAPHLGCAVVFFRGDYLDCKAVEDFICKMKKRPYYERKD
jgi:hypothetical protein